MTEEGLSSTRIEQETLVTRPPIFFFYLDIDDGLSGAGLRISQFLSCRFHLGKTWWFIPPCIMQTRYAISPWNGV